VATGAGRVVGARGRLPLRGLGDQLRLAHPLYLTGEQDLSLDNYDQDRWAIDFDYHAHPLEPALATVEAVRANTGPLIRRLPADRWQRLHHHKTYGPYTAENWLRTYAVHLHDHAQQIADNVAAWRAQPARVSA